MTSRTLTVFPARKVYTMDPGRPVAEAVAVRDGKVVSTGTLASMKPWLDRYRCQIDDTFRDHVIVPGLIDPHTHLAMSAAFFALHYVGPIDVPSANGEKRGLRTHEEVMTSLRVAHEKEPDPLMPLIAWGLDPAIQGGHLHRDELDEITSDRPTWVIAYAPHFIYLNTAALEHANIDPRTSVHGVERYPDGRLNGVFAELEASHLAIGHLRPQIQKGGGVAGLKQMASIASAAGVTTTADMVFGSNDFELEWAIHRQAVGDPEFPLRIALVPLEQPLHEAYGDRIVEFLAEVSYRNTEQLFFHGIKFLADGSFPAMSLKLNEPGYLDGGTGLRNDVPWDELTARMLPFWKAGIQIHCHANGDAAIDASLDVLNNLQLEQPRFDHRFTLEHYCISRPDQARRLKALGGVASVNNYFAHYRSQLHSNHGFGPDRSESVARLASLERENVTFALHSDYALVGVPMHPLTAAWIAIHRLAEDGTSVVGPGERIGIDRALRAITIDAAYVLNAERSVGSLEPGKQADFAVLEGDPYEAGPMSLRDIGIWGTVLSGRLHPTS